MLRLVELEMSDVFVRGCMQPNPFLFDESALVGTLRVMPHALWWIGPMGSWTDTPVSSCTPSFYCPYSFRNEWWADLGGAVSLPPASFVRRGDVRINSRSVLPSPRLHCTVVTVRAAVAYGSVVKICC